MWSHHGPWCSAGRATGLVKSFGVSMRPYAHSATRVGAGATCSPAATRLLLRNCHCDEVTTSTLQYSVGWPGPAWNVNGARCGSACVLRLRALHATVRCATPTVVQRALAPHVRRPHQHRAHHLLAAAARCSRPQPPGRRVRSKNTRARRRQMAMETGGEGEARQQQAAGRARRVFSSPSSVMALLYCTCSGRVVASDKGSLRVLAGRARPAGRWIWSHGRTRTSDRSTAAWPLHHVAAATSACAAVQGEPSY
jgi:hypothetical protein